MNIKGWDERWIWEMQGFGNVSRNGLRVGTQLRPTSKRYSPSIGGLDTQKYIGFVDLGDDMGDLGKASFKKIAKKVSKTIKKAAPILKVVGGVALGVGVLSLAAKAAATAKKAADAKKAASALKKSNNAAAAQEAAIDAEVAAEENAQAEQDLTMEVGKESATTGIDANVIRTVATTKAKSNLVLPLAIGGGVLVVGLILFLSLRKK